MCGKSSVVKIRKAADPGSGSAAWRLPIAADWSTGRWSPGTGPREVTLLPGDEAHVADVTRAGARRHLNAGERRNGGSLEGGLAIRGHAERRALSLHRLVDVDHAGHLLRVLGADLAKGRDARGLFVVRRTLPVVRRKRQTI